MSIGVLDPVAQWAEYERVVTDPRPRVSTGWAEVDDLLYRRSFGPGTFVILAGRLHTRKTTVMVNLIANFLKADVPVGLIGLDEASHMYVAKLASAFTRLSHTLFDSYKLESMGELYRGVTGRFALSQGSRPDFEELDHWLDTVEASLIERPRVLFIDYLALLKRGTYDGRDSARIPRLCEDMRVWAQDQELVVIALHQVGRQSDDRDSKNHGATPVTPEDLMYGGEQQADILLSTYRPALSRIGNMRQEDAMAEGIDPKKWQEAFDRVQATQEDTFLQLIKNRPGNRLHQQGIRLRSVGDSQTMEVLR